MGLSSKERKEISESDIIACLQQLVHFEYHLNICANWLEGGGTKDQLLSETAQFLREGITEILDEVDADPDMVKFRGGMIRRIMFRDY